MSVEKLVYPFVLESNQFILSHWRAISLSSRIRGQTHMGVGELVYPPLTGEQLVYHLALESRPIWVSEN